MTKKSNNIFPKNKETKKLASRLNFNSLDESLYFPKYFEVETVNACNAKCVMCAMNDRINRKDTIMNKDLFAKFVKEIGDYADWIETVCLNRDGEPILDKNLPERVKLLKDIGIRKVTFATNGQLLNSELVYKLINAGLDDIMISIDAASKKTFEAIRLNLDYETVVNNTLNLIRIRNESGKELTIRIRMVIMDKNRHEVKKWLAFWRPKVSKKDKVYAKPVHTWGNQIGKEKEDMVVKYADKPCVSPFSTIVIKVEGKVPLCGADYNIKNIMGDFSRQTIKEIWNAESYEKVRSLHANKQRNEIPMCRGCHIWDPNLILMDDLSGLN